MSFQNKPGFRQNFFARRYDWQTLLYREGGAMRNNAAHTRSRSSTRWSARTRCPSNSPSRNKLR